MRNIQNILFFILLLLSINYSKAQKTGEIVVKINGCKLEKGKIIVALVNNETSYLSEEIVPYIYSYIRNSAKPKTHYDCLFRNIHFGTYVIQVFYDKNDNNVLDTSFGFPKEKYGFSNNARGNFSKPDYEDVCFVLNQNQLTQQITIK